MKKIFSAILALPMLAAVALPVTAQTTRDLQIEERIETALCEAGRTGTLKSHLIRMTEGEVEESYYQVFRAILYNAYTKRCPSQFMSLTALFYNRGAHEIESHEANVYRLVTGFRRLEQ